MILNSVAPGLMDGIFTECYFKSCKNGALMNGIGNNSNVMTFGPTANFVFRKFHHKLNLSPLKYCKRFLFAANNAS